MTERGRDHAPESVCEQMSWSNIPKTVDVTGHEEDEGWRVSELKKKKKSGRGQSERATAEETRKLAPQSCVVAVQAGAQRPACYEELGAGLVIAVGVHRVGEGMNVGKVTPPRLIVILEEELEKKQRRRRN